jgi:predicted HNH restriction endonuclease
MRRWARQNGEPEHENLLALFLSLAEGLDRGELPEIEIGAAEDDDGHEGELKKLLVRHRKREHKFRAKKITDVMQRNDGHLICEVPHCGFDFHTQYGELGVGFVEVHHRKPLSQAPRRSQSIRLSDLAVVCANCHRMIHRHGHH